MGEVEALRARIAELEQRLAAAEGRLAARGCSAALQATTHGGAPVDASLDALLASRRMLALVLDTIPVRVFWKDRECRYLGCNRHFAKDAGLTSSEEIVGRNDFELAWAEQAQRYRADDRAVMESGEARVAYEEPQTAPNGSHLWLRTSKIPLRDEGGRVVGVLGVYEDITEQRRREDERLKLEAQMRHAQKLESLGVLAGGIAHDFNNLLMGVLGNVDLLRLRLAPGCGHDELRAVETAARRAADLCRQMLAYSGRGRFDVRKVQLNGLVREMTELLHVSVSKKAVLELDLDEHLPCIDADASQVRQVLMNLVTNASEALDDKDGEIRVRTGVRTFEASELRDGYTQTVLPEGEYVFLEVADTGVGMSAATRERIFEPFFTTKFTGRGLGLAAVLGIVRGHGGLVRVESARQRGTRFTVLFPATHGAPPPSEEALPTAVAAAARGRVLLVDDEPAIRAVGRDLLAHLGFEVETADNGRAALDRYVAGRYACVILDVTMPRLDGVETYRELLARDPRTRVILASGYDAHDVQGRLGALRPHGFLEKPFSLRTLEGVLAEVLA